MRRCPSRRPLRATRRHEARATHAAHASPITVARPLTDRATPGGSRITPAHRHVHALVRPPRDRPGHREQIRGPLTCLIDRRLDPKTVAPTGPPSLQARPVAGVPAREPDLLPSLRDRLTHLESSSASSRNRVPGAARANGGTKTQAETATRTQVSRPGGDQVQAQLAPKPGGTERRRKRFVSGLWVESTPPSRPDRSLR